jgi:DNA processing protein
MTEIELLHTVALLKVEGVGPVIAKNLIAYGGSAQAVFRKPPGWLHKVPDVGPKVVAALQKKTAIAEAEREVEFTRKEGIRILTFLDVDYPEALKTIHDAPLLLFKRGAADFNTQPNIAIVGTRKATAYGRKWAQQFAECFAQHGVNMVSGLAFGIDIQAHRSVVEANGITTGVVAHGLDMLYPAAHKPDAERMQVRGAILSEHFAGTRPIAKFFPQRNRILSGMCKAVVVIEAAEKGGALITAYTGFEQNREVFAVPGSLEMPFSGGCNKLIRDSVAKLVTRPEEVLIDLGLLPEPDRETSLPRHLARLGNTTLAAEPTPNYKPITVPLSADEQRLLNTLSDSSLTLDQLCERLDASAASLQPLLLALEFKGLLNQLPGRRFQRR